MGAENDQTFAYFGYFPLKFLFFLRNHLHSLENLQKFDYIITGIEQNSYIWKKIKFSFERPFWTPSWISQRAVSYANLCRQFQKLQTMPNILVYDTSCSTGGSRLPLEIVAFLAHSHPTIHNVVSECFECMLGVRQGECLSPFLFAMYLNDLEEEFRLKGSDGIDIGMLKISYYYMLMISYFLHSHQKNSKIV